MKENSELRNQLRSIRLRLKMSQQELAEAARVARQTIGGIEAELYSPSAAVALRLARALGCTVEELFWLDSPRERIVATPAQTVPPDLDVRVCVAKIGERWIAHSLDGDRGFRSEMVPADGTGTRTNDTMPIELVDDVESLARTVVVAGCAPGLSLWATSAERWFPGLRVFWINENSTESLRSLAHGEVHIAGLHLHDAASGKGNAEYVKQALNDEPAVLVHLGKWEEGLVTAAGNPKQISGVMDLCRNGVTFVNREEGSGSRILLDSLLNELNISPTAIEGYGRAAKTHQAVAGAIAAGVADVGLSVSAVASAYSLNFVSLKTVSYDLALREQSLEIEPVRQLVSTLQHRWVRQQLGLRGGYDISLTGEVTRLSG